MNLSRNLFACLLLAASGAVPADDISPADTRRGEQLYSHNCAACHGETGEGGVGVPLALPAFLDSVSDTYLATTIRLGRPGRVMPANPKLSDAEINSIIGYIREWSGNPAPVFPVGNIKGDARRGAALYQKNCAACHGANGEGGHGTGVTFSRKRDLPIIAPALNNSGYLTAASDQQIRTTLIKGRQGTPMVSFLDHGMSEQDIDDVVSFIRGFAGQAAAAKPAVKTPTDEPILMTESAYDLNTTVENVKRAATAANFRIIRVQTLEEGLTEKADENSGQVIVYFCNFNFLYQALALDPRVGLFLPCRITIIESAGKVKVMANNPLYLSPLFNNAELNDMCKQMHRLYTDMLEEISL
jgi:cytochrome c oxidase cbb3-type subunit 3